MQSDVRLGDVLQLERIAVDVDTEAQYRQIGIRSFGNGIFHRDPCLGSELSKLKYFEVHPGRIVVSNIMAWEGAIAVSSEREKGFVGSARFLSYRPTGKVDLRYLNYFFQSEAGKALIKSVSTGTVTRNQTVSPKNFENAKVLLPDLTEQRRVADKLDTGMQRIGGVLALRDHMTRIQKELHESLISSALNANLERVWAGEVLELVRDEIDVDLDAPYRAIGMRSFGKGIIHYEPVPGSELSKLKYYTFPVGAIVFNNIMAWEGAIGVTTESEREFIASQRFLPYVPTGERVNVSYLRHYFLSRPGLAQISACSPGAMARNRTLGIKKFEGIEIPLPPRDVQDRIALAIDRLAMKLAGAYAAPAASAVRPALLDAAFSGRL
ncbi:hypothetical protein F0344_26290 [Streptomyces finlayi]|uniref:Restriction endonuclease subunit S n=1 Tax=Streptomyces finlayi TaxID=67296 RepID=A0A7G7BQM4_9ACTN|nr:hypothetical protein [Streptomyces finlayi]QNE77639.1 hypothetical protein F0344_26290 [Streptomyces finlayi]